jgi:hypothetical protein
VVKLNKMIEMIKGVWEQIKEKSREEGAKKGFLSSLDDYLQGLDIKDNKQRKEIAERIFELIREDYSGENKDLGADELMDLIRQQPDLKDLFIKKRRKERKEKTAKAQETVPRQLELPLEGVEEFKEYLDSGFFNIVLRYCRESPEVEGNFPNDLETPEAVRAYLYFLLPDEEKEPFKSDFQRLVSAKEEFDPNKFFKEIGSFIEDFMEGKKKESIRFPKEWLPNEMKEKYKDNLEEKLKELGIESTDGKYRIVVTPEKIRNKIDIILESKLEISEKFREIGEKIISAQNLSKEAKKYLSSIPEGKSIATVYDGLLASIKNSYVEGIRSGMSEEEARKLLDSVTKLESQLKFLAERGKSVKSDVEKKRLLAKAKDWLKANGGTILSSIGLWGLAIGWFLPLWLISKMYNQIEKSSLGGGKK